MAETKGACREVIKPPLEVAPHWFVYRQRMQELNDAIGRYIEHIALNQHIETHSEHYGAIAQWAKELEDLALMEAELERRE